MKINEKRKAFCDYYIETLNAYESALKAGYSETTASRKSYNWVNEDWFKEYVKDRMESKENDRIASQDEVLEFLTDVMRGEVKDQFDLDAPVKERVRAGELLGKRYALFTEKHEHSGSMPVKIVDDIT